MTYSGVFSSLGFFAAFIFLVLIGMGSQAGYMTSVGTNALNYHSARGVAMGVPIACFGLSALLFAQINSRFYKEDTQGFLLFVAKSIGITILISLLFLTVFPRQVDRETLDPETTIASAPHQDCGDFVDEEAEERHRRIQERERLIPANTAQQHNTPSTLVHGSSSGFELFKTCRVAQMLFLSMLLLSGPSLMYVTNAGNVIRSIYRNHVADPTVPPTEDDLIRLQKLQDYHVSLISLCSCLGRVSVGLMSDLTKRGKGQWWGINRIGFLLYAGLCAWLGQTLGATVSDINDLAGVSILIGLGYGSVFGECTASKAESGIAPTIVSEWFGIPHFGSNWGWISVGNALGGQIFNLVFGSLYDLEAQKSTLECYGVKCFQTSFTLGAFSSITGLAVVTSLILSTKELSKR
ncbi:hypothetical protein BGZ65_004194 [Modicella reniformis]|uniref:Nodulin-like domain-containing protein n=1 Tax=Modicella reniformis TaxID=1440133 RepID=A0A9P6IKS4_9FUNG|nr:hypothetical protein BGZ65_004194 [Modicella reniformis]